MSRWTLLSTLFVGSITSLAMADFTLYASQADFVSANLAAGSVQLGLEDFSEAVGPPPDVLNLRSPLEPGVQNPIGGAEGFLDGLAQPGLWLAANPTINPIALTLIFPNAFGGDGPFSPEVGATAFDDSTELHFSSDTRFTGIAFDVSDPASLFQSGHGNETVDITVYDKNDVVMATMTGWDAPNNAHQFFGIISSEPIGWIDVQGQVGTSGYHGGEMLANIRMWGVPEPTTLSLLILSVPIVLRKR